MGADMLIAAVAIKKDQQPDFNAGQEFIKKLDLTDEALLTTLVDEAMLDEGDYFDEDGKPYIPEIREWLSRGIEEFGEAIYNRYVTTLDVRDLTLFLTGGLSHGDSTEELDAIWKMGAVPGLLGAMGFVENYWEEDKPVTPEEEAAALDSIKQASS